MRLFLQQSRNRYSVLLYHQYHQMVKLDFELFSPFEVLNTSNLSDDVEIQRTIAGNIDNCSQKEKFFLENKEIHNYLRRGFSRESDTSKKT